jgi:hypothetical protein
MVAFGKRENKRHVTLHWRIWRGDGQAIGYKSSISFFSSVTERS